MTALIEIKPLNVPDVWHVTKHMRRADWLEIINLIPRTAATPDGLTVLVMQVSKLGFVLVRNGIPVVVVQLAESHDGNWTAGMFATDAFPLVWRQTITGIRDLLYPALIDLNANCLSAWVMSKNDDAKRLLKFIGFNFIGHMAHYGTYGEAFDLYAINKDQSKNVFRKTKAATRPATS